LAADLYIGLMSGTSLDGIDAVLVDFANPAAKPELLHAHHTPYDDEIRADLLDIHHEGGDEINRAAQLSNRLAGRYAAAVTGLLQAASVSASSVVAIGCHGQTVRHRPELGYTVQLGNPAHLAETTGISVVADFRNRDIAAGGQGAPLVPAFHRAVFALPDRHRVVVNLGGIANLTNLAPGKPVTGFDCGPANMLMDAWSAKAQGARVDIDGAWAASGKVIGELLAAMLAEPYLALAPPKSTGRDLFNYAWLEPKLKPGYAAADVQRSLLEFTAEALARAIETRCAGAQEVLLCGGGARNSALRRRIGERLLTITVKSSDEAGIAVEHVEAMAFAWLARQALLGNAGNLPDVTGARGERILGAIYQA
jgi:anhydro-N-acetylmuramic acid kinase